jgi:hypothetical protein
METASRSLTRASSSGRTPTNSTADHSTAPAVTRNTVPTLVHASSNPPIAGPRKMPTLSIVLAATFAAVSSSGVRASVGTRAASAGRNAVAATPTSAAIT